MRRPATKSWPREDIDEGQGGRETDAAEPAPDEVTPPVVEAVEDNQHESEMPPLQTVPQRRGGGIVSLIIIAIVGMIIGFAAVMLM